jgi:hypothetical protein
MVNMYCVNIYIWHTYNATVYGNPSHAVEPMSPAIYHSLNAFVVGTGDMSLYATESTPMQEYFPIMI